MMSFDSQALVKYLLEGLGVALAAYYIPRRNVNLREVALIALTAAATFALLDTFTPAVSAGARQGSGFGIGANLVQGGGRVAAEGFQGAQDAGRVQDGGCQCGSGCSACGLAGSVYEGAGGEGEGEGEDAQEGGGYGGYAGSLGYAPYSDDYGCEGEGEEGESSDEEGEN